MLLKNLKAALSYDPDSRKKAGNETKTDKANANDIFPMTDAVRTEHLELQGQDVSVGKGHEKPRGQTDTKLL
jgi:hypothetical protein